MYAGIQKEKFFLFWKRESDFPLAEQRYEQDGNLVIYNVQRSDAGKYMCVGMSNGAVVFQKTINLRVIGKEVRKVLSRGREIHEDIFCVD